MLPSLGPALVLLDETLVIFSGEFVSPTSTGIRSEAFLRRRSSPGRLHTSLPCDGLREPILDRHARLKP